MFKLEYWYHFTRNIVTSLMDVQIYPVECQNNLKSKDYNKEYHIFLINQAFSSIMIF